MSNSLLVGDFVGSTGLVTVARGELIATNGPTLIGSLGVGHMMVSSGTVMTSETKIGGNYSGGIPRRDAS
jgi:hypothetical protein